MTTISTNATTRHELGDTPTTTTTRPLYTAAGHDVGYAVGALDGRGGPLPGSDLTDEIDQPWSSSVDERATELPDFSPRQRWTSVLLGALGIVALAVLVVCVLTVANDSAKPRDDADQAPLPSVTSTAAPTTTPAAPSPSASQLPAPAPASAAPPSYSNVTATASTVVVAAPPAPVAPAPKPNPDVRQRLHDLFPRLFPDP